MNDQAPFPPAIQKIADSAIKAFKAGAEEPLEMGELYEWLEVEGWDHLIADLGGQMAIHLQYLSQFSFNDNEARQNLEIPDHVLLQDADRIRWARSRLEYAQTYGDGALQSSLHAVPMYSSYGTSAYIGCRIEIQGQYGPVCEWWGLWSSPEEFFDAVAEQLQVWVTPRMGEIPDDLILSIWENGGKKTGLRKEKSAK